MRPDDATAIAAQLMSAFASRTGLYPASENQQRYLWTDAFAVCNFLELFDRTGDELYWRCATDLIDQVHQVLGRYRGDHVRQGWISGLDEQAGQHHPTKGGLRIGKPLKERQLGEPIDERLEWDRDGQYFHYLTKWMHALCRAAFVTGDPAYVALALELGAAAFIAFSQRSTSGDVVGIYWKMSTDLSRPLTYAMGLHDALDGFITLREVQHASSKIRPQRLAFRELGLAIGLMAAPTIIDRARGTRGQYQSLADKIVSAWLPLARSPDELWRAHEDINDVMLATALVPETFLSVDERMSLSSA
jgi:hypothetical protein